MTYLEKFMAENPEADEDMVVNEMCPRDSEGRKVPVEACMDIEAPTQKLCVECWNREIDEFKELINAGEELARGLLDGVNDPKPVIFAEEARLTNEQFKDIQNNVKEKLGIAFPSKEIPHILDSGNRREFGTGAVRDIQEGKGRCDLMPLDVIADWFEQPKIDPYPKRTEMTYWVFTNIYRFQATGKTEFLHSALSAFLENYDYTPTLFLEVAKHFEEGAKKYGENNWQKGIPTHCYIDSAVRHYLKCLRGDTDEPHDRAFCWNLLCCIWTCKHKPELNDYAKKD